MENIFRGVEALVPRACGKDRRLTQPPLLWVVASGAIVGKVFLFVVGCVCLSAWLSWGKGLRLVDKRPPGEVAATGAPAGQAPALAPKPEQPVCEQAVAFTPWFAFFGRFLFFLPKGDFITPTGNLLSACGQISARLHYDLFGSLKRNEPPQSTDRGPLAPRGGSESAPFQTVSSCSKLYLIGKDPSRFSTLRLFFRTRPSCSAFTRPVAMRQRSTERRRASATMAFLRAGAEALGSWSSAPHWRTARYCG